ncbi:transposase [Colletotrichum graminicola M1.001]|uniref:Transposase n=1 Tax=Colletotrichum graminicola (strain M1.001 / M2 / FGSC 10212) TaxID=645133 RepID=E3R104_COLGM|nr:transposase [Colletotrichum graminicola M1.001]EFQ36792.1 transposase [Colletotrichum graminicola M1.001]
MWKCWRHNIYLLFLPPHSSAVLQPLDVAVFSLLKQAFCKEVVYLDGWLTDPTIAGRRAFLECYFKARKISTTSQNIRSGWRAAGSWPVAMRRPLSNPLIAKAQQTTSQTSQPSSQRWDEAVSIVPWSTPHRSADLRHQLHQLTQLGQDGLDTHTIRHLCKKVQMGYGEQASRLALLERQVSALQAKLEDQRSRKSKKVPLSPNSTFATIGHIQRTRNTDTGDTDSPDESSEAENCIWMSDKP